MSARNPYLHAALKSFPMAQDQDSQDQQQQQQARQHAQQQEEQQEKVKEEVQQKEEVKAAAGAGKSGDAPPNEAPGVAAAAASTQPPPASLMSDMELAQSLKAQCQAMLDGVCLCLLLILFWLTHRAPSQLTSPEMHFVVALLYLWSTYLFSPSPCTRQCHCHCHCHCHCCCARASEWQSMHG